MTPRPDELDGIPAEEILTGTVLASEVADDLRPLVDVVAAIRTLDGTADATPPPGLIAALAEAASNAPQVAALPEAVAAKEKTLLRKILTIKAVVVAGVLALSMTGAAAANGSLPDAAQDGLAEAASHIGINLPDSASDTAREATTKAKENNRPDEAGKPDDVGAAASHGKSGEHRNAEDLDGVAATGTAADAPDHATNEHGVSVSETATDTGTEGREHGETVSTVARDGHGTTPPEDPAAAARQDGENRAEQSTTPPTPPEPPAKPEQASPGAATGAEASGGRSTAGADNATNATGHAVEATDSGDLDG